MLVGLSVKRPKVQTVIDGLSKAMCISNMLMAKTRNHIDRVETKAKVKKKEGKAVTVDQKEKMIDVALDLFSRKGYLKTSMSEIAKGMGFTKGGLYSQVEKKEDILFFIHNEMIEAFMDSYKRNVESETDKKEKLRKWIVAHVELMRDYLPHIKVFFNELDNITETDRFAEIVKRRDHVFSLLHNIIEDGIETKRFRDDINPHLLTLLLMGMLNWLYQWYRPDGQVSAEEIAGDVQKIVFEGVLKQTYE